MGAGIGAAAGATAGLLGVLLSRGPDIVLSKGSTVEMVLDRPLEFSPSELDFTNGMKRVSVDGPGPQQLDRRDSRVPMPGRRFPGRIP
jgi:type IV secretion system protein VirB10